MERRVTSHTEEEEMNQRRRLLVLARKGDEKAITRLLDLYQVRVYSGEHLRKSKIWKISKKTTQDTKKTPQKALKKAAKKTPPKTLKKTKVSKTTRTPPWRSPHAASTTHKKKSAKRKILGKASKSKKSQKRR